MLTYQCVNPLSCWQPTVIIWAAFTILRPLLFFRDPRFSFVFPYEIWSQTDQLFADDMCFNSVRRSSRLCIEIFSCVWCGTKRVMFNLVQRLAWTELNLMFPTTRSLGSALPLSASSPALLRCIHPLHDFCFPLLRPWITSRMPHWRFNVA